MSPGALVSFMLYQTSLSGAFSQIGDGGRVCRHCFGNVPHRRVAV
jgi:hypothetical protein